MLANEQFDYEFFMIWLVRGSSCLVLVVV